MSSIVDLTITGELNSLFRTLNKASGWKIPEGWIPCHWGWVKNAIEVPFRSASQTNYLLVSCWLIAYEADLVLLLLPITAKPQLAEGTSWVCGMKNLVVIMQNNGIVNRLLKWGLVTSAG